MSFDPQIVKASFDKAKPIALDVVTKIFESLFMDYPQSAQYFARVDMELHKAKIVKGLVKVIDNIDNLDVLKPYLHDLGGLHLKSNIKPENYEWFENSLIKSLAYFFGDDWGGDLNDAWVGALAHVSSLMKEGAQLQIPTPNLPMDDSNMGAIPGATPVPDKISTESLLDKINAVNKQKEASEIAKQVTAAAAEAVAADSAREKISLLSLESLESAAKPAELAIADPDNEPTLIQAVPEVALDLKEFKDLKTETSPKVASGSLASLESEVSSTTGVQQSDLPGLDATFESVAKSVGISEIGSVTPNKIDLPDDLMTRIQETATAIVRQAIEKELETALENELKRYLETGVSEFLRKSS